MIWFARTVIVARGTFGAIWVFVLKIYNSRTFQNSIFGTQLSKQKLLNYVRLYVEPFLDQCCFALAAWMQKTESQLHGIISKIRISKESEEPMSNMQWVKGCRGGRSKRQQDRQDDPHS